MGSSPPLSPPRGEVLAVAPAIWKVVERHPVLGAVTHKDADGDTLGSALGGGVYCESRLSSWSALLRQSWLART